VPLAAGCGGSEAPPAAWSLGPSVEPVPAALAAAAAGAW